MKLLVLWLSLFLCSSVNCTFCGSSQYTSSSGIIFLYDYDRGTYCQYRIMLNDSSRWIRLTWTFFKIDGDMPTCKDYVEVYTGCNNEKKVAKFCSNNMVSSLPHDIYSRDGCMRIKLYAPLGSTSKSHLGFSASYNSGSGSANVPSSICSSYFSDSFNKYGKSGVIASPNWPEAYKPSYSWHDVCKVTINRNSGELIQLNFMDFDIPFSSMCSMSYVKIEGKKYNSFAYLNSKYCGLNTPRTTMNTKFYNLDLTIKYNTYTSTKYRGFAVGYIVYKNDNGIILNNGATSNRPSSGVRIIATAVAIVVCIIFFVFLVTLRMGRHACIFRHAALINSPAVSRVVIGSITTNEQTQLQQHFPERQPPQYSEQSPYLNFDPPSYSDAMVDQNNQPKTSLVLAQTTPYPPTATIEQSMESHQTN